MKPISNNFTVGQLYRLMTRHAKECFGPEFRQVAEEMDNEGRVVVKCDFFRNERGVFLTVTHYDPAKKEICPPNEEDPAIIIMAIYASGGSIIECTFDDYVAATYTNLQAANDANRPIMFPEHCSHAVVSTPNAKATLIATLNRLKKKSITPKLGL